MSDVRAKFPIATIDRDRIDKFEFISELAEWADKYVDEIAMPVMAAASELYENDAIVVLVNKWYHAHHAYQQSRLRYLVDMAEYAEDPSWNSKPHLCQSWEKDNEGLYGQALSAILIR